MTRLCGRERELDDSRPFLRRSKVAEIRLLARELGRFAAVEVADGFGTAAFVPGAAVTRGEDVKLRGGSGGKG